VKNQPLAHDFGLFTSVEFYVQIKSLASLCLYRAPNANSGIAEGRGAAESASKAGHLLIAAFKVAHVALVREKGEQGQSI